MIFIVESDIQESDRRTLIQHFKTKGVELEDYKFNDIRMAFLELLVAPKSTIDDPNMRSNLARQYGHRSFCCIEDSLGECEGTTGYWVEDDNSGLVGFLEEFENEEGFSTFWL